MESERRIVKVFEISNKLKSAMLKKGITYAKTNCPFCKVGMLYGKLMGKKNHLHMNCNSCDVALME